MRLRTLAALLLLAVPASPARAAEAPGDHLVVHVAGAVRTGGCEPICDGPGDATFSGTITTIEDASVVVYPFTSDIVWDGDCGAGSAYGTLYFGANAWPFSWTETGPALLMFANDQATANFTGPGLLLVPPQPVGPGAASCASDVTVTALLVRGPRPGPI